MLLEDAIEKIYPKILKFVSLQQRTKKEVSDRTARYLQKFEIDQAEKDEIKTAVTIRMEEAGLVDDKRYAKDFVNIVTSSSKPRGDQYIKRFLLKKGVPLALVESELANLNEEDQYEAARRAAEKKLKTIKAKNPFELKKKLWNHLASCGFRSNIIGHVIDTILGVN